MSLADPGQITAAPLALPEESLRVRVIERPGGYVLQTEHLSGSSGQVAGLALMFLCSVFSIAAALVWLAPSDAFASDATTHKAAASAVLAAIALLISLKAEPRPAPRIEVDLRRREVRDCLLLSRGRVKLRRAVRLSDLSGVATAEGGEIVLHGSGTPPIVIAPGLGAARTALMARLGRDIVWARTREQGFAAGAPALGA